ncbi:unnamed protein product, partial [Protopolystoma xenopodis]
MLSSHLMDAEFHSAHSPVRKLLSASDFTELIAKVSDGPRHSLIIDVYQVNHGTPPIILIVTPIMQRVMEQPQTAEMIHCEITSVSGVGTCTSLLANSFFGTLPIAVMIHSNKSKDNYLRAVTLFKKCFPNPFGGKMEPQGFILPPSILVKSIFQKFWPNARHLVGLFQFSLKVQEALKNRLILGLQSEHMKKASSLFRQMRDSKSEAEFEKFYEEAFELTDLQSVRVYFRQLRERRSEWALYLRKHLLTRGMNNYSSSSYVVALKSNLAGQNISSDPVGVVEIVATVVEQKLFNIIGGKVDRSVWYRVPKPLLYASGSTSKWIIRPCNSAGEEVYGANVNSSYFKVKDKLSGQTENIVNISIGTCTCEDADYGVYCNHQAAAARVAGIYPPNAYEVNREDVTSYLRFGTSEKEKISPLLSSIASQLGTREQASASVAKLINKPRQKRPKRPPKTSAVKSFGSNRHLADSTSPRRHTSNSSYNESPTNFPVASNSHYTKAKVGRFSHRATGPRLSD